MALAPESPAPTADFAAAARIARDAWRDRPAADLVSEAVRFLTAGTATDWGLSGKQPTTDKPPISLGGGIPDAETQPRQELLAAAGRVLDEPGDAALVYGGPQGYEPLREEVGKFFASRHPSKPGADWFLMTNGAAGAIEAVCAAVLDPGDVVLSEAPTFAGSLRTIRGRQAEVRGVGLDDEGIDLDQLQAAIARARSENRPIKLLYTQPTFHNPTGLTMTLQRRLDLLQLAAENGIFILEDHAYSELYFDAPPPPTLSDLADGWGVFSIGTFSKVIATGLRVGWVQARPEWINALLPARFDMGNSPLLHRMLHEYIVRGGFPQHVQNMRSLYAAKSRTLQSALAQFGEPYFDYTPPQGGFFLWLQLHQGLTADQIRDHAAENALFFPSGHRFYPGDDTAQNPQTLRLAYSWPPQETLEEAATRLSAAFNHTPA